MVFCNLQNLEWITIIVLASLAAGRRSAVTAQHEDKKLAAHVKFSMNNQEDHSPVMAPFFGHNQWQNLEGAVNVHAALFRRHPLMPKQKHSFH